MKVQIIYLDPEDDHVSARDKLSWAQAPYLALVWPLRGRPLTRRLDLVLLQRHARQMGAQIGLVTSDPDVRENARQLGIPYFNLLDEVPPQGWHRRQRATWPQPTPSARGERQWQAGLFSPAMRPAAEKHPALGVRLLAFTLAILAVLALLAAMIPSAQVALTPPIASQQLTLTIHLDPDAAVPSATGDVPARQVRMRILGETQAPTQGQVLLPWQAASVTIVFTNLSTEALTIPAGTGVRSTGQPAIRFTTLEDALLQAQAGATVSVAATAADPGTVGNVPAGSLQAIDGLLGLSVSADNPEPATGGEDRLRPGVSEADQLELQQALTAQLIDQAVADRQQTLGLDEVLARETVTVSQIYSRHFDQAVGEAASTLSLTLDLELVGLVYRPEDLHAAAQLALNGQMPPNRAQVPGSLEVEELTGPVAMDGGRATFTLQATQGVFEPLDTSYLAGLLRGLEPGEAAELLEENYQLSVAEIRLFPSWWQWMPWLSPRIHILWDWESL